MSPTRARRHVLCTASRVFGWSRRIKKQAPCYRFLPIEKQSKFLKPERGKSMRYLITQSSFEKTTPCKVAVLRGISVCPDVFVADGLIPLAK
jgi:hypothetical protein